MAQAINGRVGARIFGIGLNKTGTTSLAWALDHLGISTRHGYSGRQLRMELEKGGSGCVHVVRVSSNL